MAQNSIGYEARIIATKTPIKFAMTQNGMAILELVLAEQHQMKKARALKDPALKKYAEADTNMAKGADDWINTTTSWHRLTVFGEKAEAYAQNPEINHGALVTVDGAGYTEEGEWETKDGVLRAGRPETIGDKSGDVSVKFAPRDPVAAVWDGVSSVPTPGGNGGGPAAAVNNYEGEGF